MKYERRRLGRVALSGDLLNQLLSVALNSEITCIARPKYQTENDTFVFLCEGPDFPEHYEGVGMKPQYVDSLDLERLRKLRENSE